MVAKTLEALGPKVLFGYDIGCKFLSTILHSSLSEAFLREGHHFIVNAFHGYTHSYDCQNRNHPNVTPGAGLEDFETMERIFSSSNVLASIIRYASSYRRRLFIVTYFGQWDQDKYANTGDFLYNNYIQALKTLQNDQAALRTSLGVLGVTESQLEEWEKEERVFFSTVGKERPWDIHAVAYVEALQRLRELESERSANTSRFNNTIPVNYEFVGSNTSRGYWQEASKTRELEKKRRKTIELYGRALDDVIDLELHLDIDASQRWTPASPEYIETVKYIAERKYHRSLDKLHKLVIQRLFELHKLNLAQTGMFFLFH